MVQAAARPAPSTDQTAPVRDLHWYLDWVEREFPGDVVHVEQEISAQYEVTALLMKLHHFKLKNLPILVFHKVRTCDGELSPFPLVVNLSSSPAHFARYL